MANMICFDLEGPLSPQDNAYEVLGLIPDGEKIFETLSRYDDILTLEKRENYEPGDTLSLIIPFILHHKISEKDIRKVSDKAKIVDGVRYTINRLRKLDFDPHIISTSYQQHAYNIGSKIGVPKEKIYCTKLPLKEFNEELFEADYSLVSEVENDILRKLYPALEEEKKLKERLDRFFYHDLEKTKLGEIRNRVKVVGGQRKVNAMLEILRINDKKKSEVIAIGDSITDFKMLRDAGKNGGLGIVFNGNEFAVPNANIALASQDMRFVLIIVEAYAQEGREAALRVACEWEKHREDFVKAPEKIPAELVPEDVRKFMLEKKSDKDFTFPYIHLPENIGKKKEQEIVAIHKKFRKFVRGDAAKLG